MFLKYFIIAICHSDIKHRYNIRHIRTYVSWFSHLTIMVISNISYETHFYVFECMYYLAK